MAIGYKIFCVDAGYPASGELDAGYPIGWIARLRARTGRRRKREEEETHSYSNIQYLARVPAQSLRQIHSFVIGIIH
uniref:Uncharacterized protein n=1 Tax=Oryza glumipatula TaxID=40148 RepID=A0A0E0BPB5_9ORYZ